MGIKLNQNIKIMKRKVLKDKIDELRSTAKMELACTIREIMREHNVSRKVFDWPVLAGDNRGGEHRRSRRQRYSYPYHS